MIPQYLLYLLLPTVHRRFSFRKTGKEREMLNNKNVGDNNIKSLNTAKKYLGQLEKLKILVSEKTGKEVVYLNIDLFSLLSEI